MIIPPQSTLVMPALPEKEQSIDKNIATNSTRRDRSRSVLTFDRNGRDPGSNGVVAKDAPFTFPLPSPMKSLESDGRALGERVQASNHANKGIMCDVARSTTEVIVEHGRPRRCDPLFAGEGGGEVRNGFELNREKRIGRSDVFLAGRVKPCLVISVPALGTVHLVAGQCTVIPGLLPTVDLQWPCCWPTVTLMSWPSVTLMPNSFLNSFVVTLKVRPAFVPASRSYQQRWLADWLQAVFLRYAPLRRTKHNWSCLRIIARSFVALLFCYWKQRLGLRPRPHSEAPTASQWPVPMDCSPRLNSAWYEVHAVPLLHNTS